jgi:hypothetical protein
MGTVLMRARRTEADAKEEADQKGIKMLRLAREMEPILEAWRKAKRENPDDWK